MSMKEAQPANAIMGFAGWLTSRKEVSGPFSECHDAAQMAELVHEYCTMYGLDFDDTFSYRDAEQERRAGQDEIEQDVASEDAPAGGMAAESHIAWFFYDVMCSWAGRDVMTEYARACVEFPPSKNQLPPKFRDEWLRLVSIWASR